MYIQECLIPVTAEVLLADGGFCVALVDSCLSSPANFLLPCLLD